MSVGGDVDDELTKTVLRHEREEARSEPEVDGCRSRSEVDQVRSPVGSQY